MRFTQESGNACARIPRHFHWSASHLSHIGGRSCERGHTREPKQGSPSRVEPMRKWDTRHHHGKAILMLPVVLAGFLIGQFALLPAHGLPAHAALMGHTAAATSGTDTPHHVRGAAEQASAAGAPGAQSPHSGSEDQHDTGAPYCHPDQPHPAWPTPLRFVTDDWTGLGNLLHLAISGPTLNIPLLSWLRTRHRQWSSRPPWRPAGRELLTSVCLSRT